MKSNFHQPLIWIFALLVNAAYAQPVIVKDYNNCTVGLQNEKGEWIAQPVYSSIEPFDGNYTIVCRNNRYGLINARGVEVIEPTWYSLNELTEYTRYGVSTHQGLYIGRSSAYYCAVIDTNGNILTQAPLSFQGIFRDSVVCAIDSANDWHLVHLNGKTIDLPSKINKQPEWIAHNCYKITYDSLPWYPYQFHGVVNTTGKIIVPVEFTSVKYFSNPRVVFQVNNMYYTGYYSVHGDVIWPCEFVFSPADPYSQFQFERETCVALHHDKWGVVSWEGDTVIPFIYKNRPWQCLRYDGQKIITSYVVWVDSSYGLLSESNNWIIPPVYDYLWPVTARWVVTEHLLCSKQGKWGCINSQGEPLIHVTYDTAIVSADRGIFFISDTNVVFLSFTQPKTEIGVTEAQHTLWSKEWENRTPVYKDLDYPQNPDTTSNYAWEDYAGFLYDKEFSEGKPITRLVNPYPYEIIDVGRWELTFTRLDSVVSGQSTAYISYEPDYVPGRNFTVPQLVVYRQQGQTIHYYTSFTTLSDTYSTFNNRHGTGLITNDGKVIAEPGRFHSYRIYDREKTKLVAVDRFSNYVFFDTAGIISNRVNCQGVREFAGDTVWLADYHSKLNTSNNRTYAAHCGITYTLYDLSANRPLLDSSLCITSIDFEKRQEPIIFESCHGEGIINPSTLRILIDPIYKRVEPLDKSNLYYVVETCSQKIGILDSNNHALADTIYTSLIQVKEKTHYYSLGWRDSVPAHEDALYLLISDSLNYAVFSTTSGTRKNDSTDFYDEILLTIQRQSHEQYDTITINGIVHSYSNRCENCFEQVANFDADSLSSWQSKFIFQTMFLQRAGMRTAVHYRDYFHDCTCDSKPQSSQIKHSQLAHRPVFVKYTSDSVLSLVYPGTNIEYETSYKPTQQYLYVTTILFPVSPRVVTLDSLFVGDEWRQLVTDSLMSYLNNHKGIDADCSRPGLLPNTVNNRFLIMGDGIHLFPDWTKQTDGNYLEYRPEIVLPWSALDPYLRMDIRTKLPGH